MHRRFGTGATILTLGHKRHGLGHHFMLAALLPIFGFPSALLQPTLDNHAVPLAEILPAMFGLFTKDHNIDKTHFFLQIVALFKPATDRQAKTGYRRPARRIPKLGIPSEVSESDDFVKSGHRLTPAMQLPLGAAPLMASHDEPSET